jgi:hypothetical protein
MSSTFNTYYHGTSIKNLGSILKKGILASPFEQGVYLTDSKESALAWMSMRLLTDDILVIELTVDDSKIEPGIDHTPLVQKLFGCGESYLYKGDIPPDQLLNYIQYSTKQNEREKPTRNREKS